MNNFKGKVLRLNTVKSLQPEHQATEWKLKMQKGWYFTGRDSLTRGLDPREFLLVGVANQQQTGKIT